MSEQEYPALVLVTLTLAEGAQLSINGTSFGPGPGTWTSFNAESAPDPEGPRA